MASKCAGLTAVLAASNLALAVAKPVVPIGALHPKVEIDYANITGRINGNIKEFLGALRKRLERTKAESSGCLTNIYKVSPSPRPVASSTRSSIPSS